MGSIFDETFVPFDVGEPFGVSTQNNIRIYLEMVLHAFCVREFCVAFQRKNSPM